MSESETPTPTQEDMAAAQTWEWTTKSGKRQKLGEMEDSHLENLLRYARSKLSKYQDLHDDFFLWMLDDKNRSSSSGCESHIEAWQIAVTMTYNEIYRRKVISSKKQKAPT